MSETDNHISVNASKTLDSVKQSPTLTEKILSFFPGYQGYKEKEIRRETDKLVRNIVFRKMKQTSDSIRALYRENLELFGLVQETKTLERLSLRSDAIAERIRHAVYGYSPLLNAIKVDEAALDRLIEFDANLAENVNNIDDIIRKTKTESSSKKIDAGKIEELEKSIALLELTFEKRGETLTGLGEL